MSLLRRTPSLSDSIDHEDDIPSQTSGWSKLLDGQDDNDGFMTDDDDDLSFDGIYDDQPDAPPHYQSSPPDVDSLHRRLGALTMGPNKVPVKGRFPRSQPYYPGIDICIVRASGAFTTCPKLEKIGLSGKAAILEEWPELSNLRSNMCRDSQRRTQ